MSIQPFLVVEYCTGRFSAIIPLKYLVFFNFIITTIFSFRDPVALLHVIIVTHSVLDLCPGACRSLSKANVRVSKHFKCCTLIRKKFPLAEETVQNQF